MPKYTVHAQVTVYQELEIEASCRDEAIMIFNEELEAKYGWVDFDTVSVDKEEE